MQGECSANFLFSEDFERMIDFDYSSHKFVIQRIGTNVDPKPMLQDGGNPKFLSTPNLKITGSPFLKKDEIDHDYIDLNFVSSRKSEDVIAEMAKRICWRNKQHIEIINDQGVSCILKYTDQVYDDWLKERTEITARIKREV